MDQFFLSYSRADQTFALRLAADLRESGAAVWVDQFDILPSQHWDRAVEAALRASIGVVLVLSPRSVASENVADEISVALDSGKKVIPVLHEKCVAPLRLARVQFIDATIDYEAALARVRTIVLAALAGDAPPSAPMRAPPPAPVAPASPPAPAAAEWDPAVIGKAEKHLAQHVGPIAGILVKKAAAQARSEPELYHHLAAAIPNPAERSGFLGRAGHAPADPAAAKPDAPAARSAPVFEPGFLDKVAEVLTHYLGPIARHIVAREQQAAPSRDELLQRLSARVPAERERATVLAKLRALPTS